ncbi:MAG: amidohydrolase family protein [Planctomycetaceae bacterium]
MLRWISTALLVCFPTAAVAADPDAPLDLVIVGGRVMDGTGNPWFAADVGIRDGRIVAIGELSARDAKRRFDADGKIVCPGFIDLHSHAAEGFLSEDARRRAAPNLVTQGITTAVLNPDGYSPLAVPEQKRRLAQGRIGMNAILMVGHNTIRRETLGENFRRSATPGEIDAMRKLVREGMEAGAFGLTAGLEYVPGIWSTPDEIVALVEEIVPYGGAYIVHERASGADPMWYVPSRHPPGQPTMVDNILELIDVGRRTKATVVATHIKARGTDFWGSSGVLIQLIDRARAEGISIYADQYPYNTSGSDGRITLIPGWAFGKGAEVTLAPKYPGPKADQPRVDHAALLEKVLADDESAADLRKDVAREIVRRGGAENIVVMESPDSTQVGRSLHELARESKIEPVEMVFKLQLAGDAHVPGGVRLRGFSMSEADVEAFAATPWTATATDARITLPEDEPDHARYYGSFPRKIRHYALARRAISIEHAVRSSSSLPAQILGLRDRGLIREGFHADVVVFDPERIRDRATFEDPHRTSVGLDLVLVGGTVVVEHDQPTGALPGVVIENAGRKGEPRR